MNTASFLWKMDSILHLLLKEEVVLYQLMAMKGIYTFSARCKFW